MLQAKLLNSEATLNDFLYLGSVEFVPGENVTVCLQLFNSERAIRFIPPAAATLTLTFTNSDGDQFDKVATKIDVDDRSLWKVSFTQVETETLAGQNIIATLDVNGDASKILIAFMPNVIIRSNLSGDC